MLRRLVFSAFAASLVAIPAVAATPVAARADVDTTPRLIVVDSLADGDVRTAGDPALALAFHCDDGSGSGVAVCTSGIQQVDPPGYPGGPLVYHQRSMRSMSRAMSRT